MNLKRSISKVFNARRSIGIDLGTANTLVYDKQREKIILNEPSVVAIDKRTKKVLAVGKEAKNMLGKTPDSIIAVRPLREGVIADYNITEAMIEYFIKKIFGKYNLLMPDIMICVPIEVTGVERRAVKEAAREAGARRTYMIEEARAAALGSGIDISAPEGSMIIDIGGGSTDIAVISLKGTVVSRSLRIGGNNFDMDIIKYLKKNYNLLIGERTAEMIKMKIGTAMFEKEPLKLEVKGRNLRTGLPNTIQLNSNDILEAIQNSLNMIINSTKQVLEETPPELSSDIIDKGIVMTGGGALISRFTELVSEKTELPVYLADNPLYSVVLGTGIALDKIDILAVIEKDKKCKK